MFPILTSQQSLSPSSIISYSTLLILSNYVIFSLRSAANLKHSLGVKVPSSASSCITYPIWFEYASTDETATPLIRYSPSSIKLSDISLPAKKFKNVVLPDPDGPNMAVKDSAGTMPF